MSISTVANSIVDTVKGAAGTILGGIKTAAQWSGRVVTSAFRDYLVPAVQAVWSRLLPLIQATGRYIKIGVTSTVQFLRTGFGLGGGLAVIGLGLVLHGYEQKDRKTQIAEQLSGIALIALGVGVAVAFKAAQVA
jgi:ABC-type nitrate/sulfonate/bicarbonate transport system permease component